MAAFVEKRNQILGVAKKSYPLSFLIVKDEGIK